MTEQTSLINSRQAAKLLKLNVRTVRYYVMTGRLHPVPSLGRGHMFEQADIEAFRARRERERAEKAA